MQSDSGYRSIANTLHMNCTNGNLPIDFNFHGYITLFQEYYTNMVLDDTSKQKSFV